MNSYKNIHKRINGKQDNNKSKNEKKKNRMVKNIANFEKAIQHVKKRN